MKYHMSLTTVLLLSSLTLLSLDFSQSVFAAEKRGQWEKQTDTAWQSYCNGDYQTSANATKKAHSRSKEPTQKAISLCNLASLKLQEGQYAQAELLYLQVKESIDQTNFDPTHYQVLLNDLAVLYFRWGKYDQSQFYYDQILSDDESFAQQDDPVSATMLNNLGSLSFKKGDLDKAQKYYERALSIHKNAGKKHNEYARVLNNLGVVYAYKDRLDDANKCYEEALLIRRNKFGTDSNHPDLAHSFHNLARLRTWQGQFESARGFFELSLSKRVNTFGPEHPEIAASYNGMAELALAQAQHSKALALYNKALSMRLKLLGEHHSDTAASYFGLAQAHECLNDTHNARLCYQKALSIQEKVLGRQHPEALKTKLALLKLDSLTAYET